MKLIHRLHAALTDRGNVTFCDACSRVCDRHCRADALRGHARSTVTQTPRI